MAGRKGMLMSPRGMTEEERFWSKVDKSAGPDGCWEWMAALDCGGYGKWSPVPSKTYKAHRYAYTLACGSIPDGMCVCHHCDNPRCVNPGHLFIGTLKDNHDDMKAKGRGLSGEKNGRAKLSASQVHGIRSRYASGGISYKSLGALFGVSEAAVRFIIIGRNWAKLEAK